VGEKAFTTAFGKASSQLENQDTLLAGKISDRERNRIAREEEKDEAKHKAEMAKLRKEETSADAAVEKTGEKKEDTGGIKTKGEFNIGSFNIQEMLQQQITDRDKLKDEAETAAANQQQISNDLRERLHAADILVLKTGFEAQMQMLTKMIESNASKGNFTEELTAARTIAEELGYQKGAAGGGSEMIQLELKKLDFEHQMAMRKMAKEDKSEERRWQMELRRLDDERESKKAELAQQAKKDDMFAKAPEVIGRAIGRAAMESSGGVGAEAPVSAGGKTRGIEVGLGEGGEFPCVQCKQPVAIGPTARSAVCAGCGMRYPIQRVQPEAPAPIKGQEPQTVPEDLEE